MDSDRQQPANDEPRSISEIEGAKWVSTSPDGSLYLMRETGADDDLRHFVVRFVDGRLERGPRIGGRYVTRAEWSSDSQWITFHNQPGLSESDTEVIKVEF